MDKRTSAFSFFIFSAIKLRTKACDKPLASFYWGSIDITSTAQMEQENKSWPGNFFVRDNAQRFYLAWPMWRLQNAFTGITDPLGRVLQRALTCCFTWYFHFALSLSCEVDGFTCTLSSTDYVLPSSMLRWFQANPSCGAQSSFHLNCPVGQALTTCRGVQCSRSMAKIQQCFKIPFTFRSKCLHLGTQN